MKRSPKSMPLRGELIESVMGDGGLKCSSVNDRRIHFTGRIDPITGRNQVRVERYLEDGGETSSQPVSAAIRFQLGSIRP